MLKPTVEEKRILSTFFRCAAPQFGLFDREKIEVRPGAEKSEIFQKNLKILRDIRRKLKIPANQLEDSCRFCIRDKVRVNWISEVPGIVDEVGDVGRNLLSGKDVPLHRLLRRVFVPATRLDFEAAVLSTLEEAEPCITCVERFTMSDLISHFKETFGVHYTKALERSFLGSFNYLISAYGLDAVLFAIDVAAEDENAYITKPLDLDTRHYMTLAVEEVRHRRMRLEAPV